MPGFTTALELNLNRSADTPYSSLPRAAALHQLRRPRAGAIPFRTRRAPAYAVSFRMSIHCLLPSGARPPSGRPPLTTFTGPDGLTKNSNSPLYKHLVNLLLIFFRYQFIKRLYIYNTFHKIYSICFFPVKLDSSCLFR